MPGKDLVERELLYAIVGNESPYRALIEPA